MHRSYHSLGARLAGQEGSSLLVVLMMLLALGAMAATTVMIGSTDLVVTGNHRQGLSALNVAEAGISEAMHRMNLAPGTMVNVGGSAVDASIQDPTDPPDPNWRARIFLTTPDAAPAAAPGELSTGTIQAPGDYMRYAHASDPSQAITIEHKTRDFDGDGTQEVVFYDPSRVPHENPLTGAPVERITVTGMAGNANRRVRVDVIRFPITPNVNAALQADGEVDLRGNITVCGHNHRADTPFGTKLPNCSPNWDEPDGHLVAVMTAGYDVDTRGSTDLLGNPVAINTDPANVFNTLAGTLGISQEDLQAILDQADHTSVDANPLIGVSYLQGDWLLTNVRGEGLLYVTGDLHCAGNFEWRGLVYVEGDMKNVGSSWILGGAVVKGNTTISVQFGSGNATLLYSRDAMIQALMQSMRYTVLAWKEM